MKKEIHEGDLIIHNMQDAERYKNVTKVTGYLYIHASAKLDAPKLESVGGNLSINASAKLDALKSVGGNLYIHASAKLDALKSVGGNLYIYKKGSLVAGKLYTGGYDKFKVYDNIACVVLSSKQKVGVTILSCRHAKIKNQKVVGDKFYVAQSNGHNAHGKTIKEAVRELQFKTGDRDINQYKNMPLTTNHSPQEWAFIYRMVTGAFQYDVQKFTESKGKLKKNYSLKEILEQTQGAYGYEEFRSVVAP